MLLYLVRTENDMHYKYNIYKCECLKHLNFSLVNWAVQIRFIYSVEDECFRKQNILMEGMEKQTNKNGVYICVINHYSLIYRSVWKTSQIWKWQARLYILLWTIWVLEQIRWQQLKCVICKLSTGLHKRILWTHRKDSPRFVYFIVWCFTYINSF